MVTTAETKLKNKFGQYFTPERVADFMIELADISIHSKILEPSCGEGIFLRCLQKKGFNNIIAYEIDKELAQGFKNVQYESFISAKIEDTFDLVIGNPPYIRWKNLEESLKQELLQSALWNKYFNSLCDYLYIFILKSIELLKENGQLIFICPEYWMTTTHSLSLRNYMVSVGHFEDIYHFNETPIFDKVSVSLIIFKFVKTKKVATNIKVAKFSANQKLTSETLAKLKQMMPLKDAQYLEISPFKLNERWLLQSDEVRKELQILEKNCLKKRQNPLLDLFEEGKELYHTIAEFCDIGNGLVSGLDKAFQVNGDILNEAEERATVNVIKAKDLSPFWAGNITKYIFIQEVLTENDFLEKYPHFYQHLQPYKEDLDKRYEYKQKIHYWEWSFSRNFSLFSKKEQRIFVPCKERISHKKHFRFAFVEADVFPTQDVTAIFKKATTKESIEYILAYLNLLLVFDWLTCHGIVKGNIVEFSEKPIASIPFRAINWNNLAEVSLHNAITEMTQQYIQTREKADLEGIYQLFTKLFER